MESPSIKQADELCCSKQHAEAMNIYLQMAATQEVTDGGLCLKIARCAQQSGDDDVVSHWLCRVVDGSDDFLNWQAAGALLSKVQFNGFIRSVKLAVLGSYTTTQFIPMLKLAALRQRINLEIYECPFGQYQQEIIDERSKLYAFDPEIVLLATHAGDLNLPELSQTPGEDVANERKRITNLWQTLTSRCSARIIQHNFAVPDINALGNLAAKIPGSRLMMMNKLNAALGETADDNVSIVNCEALSSQIGKSTWFDDRYWIMSKQAVSLSALPLLANHTIAVLASSMGLSKKCLVLDLDNTLWGGVIGEDGLSGITLGSGPVGEAFVALQEYILDLKNRGIILAVCSKNNDADAREPFKKHPDMVLKLSDIAMFVANWEPKPHNIRNIAKTLNIGLDSLVFLDDNPVEREAVRSMICEVDVIAIGNDPMQYRRTLSEYLMFEVNSITAEDAVRTEQYKAKAEISQLKETTLNIDEFYRGLQMQATIKPFDEMHLPRITQLIGKSNQFNLTTRRHSLEQLRSFMADPDYVHLYMKLSDRFTDHGLVSVLIAQRIDGVLDIDTWLMSCRVIGRTVEAQMLAELCDIAQKLGCQRLRGTYIPTAKNALVADLYERFGFTLKTQSDNENQSIWEYDIRTLGSITNGFIEVINETSGGQSDAA